MKGIVVMGFALQQVTVHHESDELRTQFRTSVHDAVSSVSQSVIKREVSFVARARPASRTLISHHVRSTAQQT